MRRGTRNGITELSQSAPPIFGWTAITLGIGPHSAHLVLIFIVTDHFSGSRRAIDSVCVAVCVSGQKLFNKITFDQDIFDMTVRLGTT